MDWYLKVLNQYADFGGRARRKEYWMFILFNALFTAVAGAVGAILGTELIPGLYSLVIFIPLLAVSVRRLHDTGKSGWMILIGLIPLIGQIWLLILFVTDGEPGVNQYGANPKEDSFY